MGASPDALPGAPLRPHDGRHLGVLVLVTISGRRRPTGRACPAPTSPPNRLMPNRRSCTPATTAPLPTATPTGTPIWVRIRHDRRCKVNMTIFMIGLAYAVSEPCDRGN